MTPTRNRSGSLLIAASALAACVGAWLAQHGPAPSPVAAPAQRPAVAWSEAPSATIRLQRFIAAGPSCLRLRPVRPYESAFGGAGADSAASEGAPSRLSASGGELAYTRGPLDAWPGQSGGDAGRP